MYEHEFPFFETGRYKPNKLTKVIKKIPEHISVRGLKRPNIMYDVDAVKRVKKHFPDVRVIVSLRNPVSRFISAYYHHLNTAKGTLKHPDQYVNEMDTQNCKLLRFSFYSRYLKHILDVIGEDYVLVIWQEELKAKPYETLNKVYNFLELPFRGRFWKGSAKQKTDDYINIIINRHIHRIKKKGDKPMLYHGTPQSHKWYFNQLRRIGNHLNLLELSPQLKFSKKSKQQLWDILEPDVQRLYNILDVNTDPMMFYNRQ